MVYTDAYKWGEDPKRASGKEQILKTLLGKQISSQQHLEIHSNRNHMYNWNSWNYQNSWLLTHPFTFPQLIWLPQLILLSRSILLLLLILLPTPIPFQGFALPSIQVYRFPLYQFALKSFALFWIAFIQWLAPLVCRMIAVCSDWTINVRRQNRWYNVGQSGTTMQWMSSTVWDTSITIRILSSSWFFGGHKKQLCTRGYGTWVYWAGWVYDWSCYKWSLVWFHSSSHGKARSL